jgi:hypothetical protein
MNPDSNRRANDVGKAVLRSIRHEKFVNQFAWVRPGTKSETDSVELN